MSSDVLQKQTTRREILRSSATLAGSAFVAQLFPGSLLRGAMPGLAQEAADRATAFRAQFAAIPMQTQKISDNLTLLSGPGGNVVVLTGSDGKIVVDTFVSPAWPKLKEALDALGNAPLKYVIDTHWHFDHADNNAPLHAAGATVVAHENTKKRMSAAQDIPVLDLHFPPSPADALPQQTFATSHKLQANGETLTLQHFSPAHTDSDIYVYFEKANVIHMGDTYFTGFYPFIDAGSGGKVSGMIAAADKVLPLADNNTKIVPGHGPLGSKADLGKFRDMLVTTRDRVQKLKSAGKSADDIAASKPFADLEATWGHGILTSDQFVHVVYLTL
ncbi:MAG TPA: MBL fold metallo-hydrolase [Candidatus Dormibacteraeota bacterium]|nr:MBL fold metallo-hydrolase [Candidatus Dormibacteraeota bacterium]